MKILFITHAVFLDPTRISSGNSVRGFFIAKGLAELGHQVLFASPKELERFASMVQPPPGIVLTSFSDAASLAHLLRETHPHLLLVGYWELLELLPDKIAIPVVLDVVAPRVLEALFQPERELASEVRRMLNLYRKADHFLVGSERQRHFLLPWLIMAGFAVRDHSLIDVVPISTDFPKAGNKPAPAQMLRLVSGGVDWPWRRSGIWFEAIISALRAQAPQHSKLVLFSGEYIYSSAHNGEAAVLDTTAPSNDVLENHALLSYAQMQDYLEQHCHIGLELAERNVEREYSQSFRAMEFLRAGLPLICNDYLELAQWIRQYDAGWVVHEPADLAPLLIEILHEPALIKRKSLNAQRLIAERLHYQKTIQPLAQFVQHPRRHFKCAALFNPEVTPSAHSKLSLTSRILSSGKRRILRWLSNILRSKRCAPNGRDIVMVTRSDIFPVNHGGAVKIDRTAAALSHFVPAVYLVTDERRIYYVYRQGKIEEQRFPAWLSWIAPPRFLVRHRALQQEIPMYEAFLYYPMFDWSYILRTIYLALRYPINVFQAEFPAYARACLWGRSLLGGRVLLVEHNVEYQRLADQHSDLSPAAFNWLRQVEISLCQQSDLVIAVSERDRSQLVADGVAAERVHYIPHGVDLSAFAASAALDIRAQYAIGAEYTVLVYHGTYMYPPNLQAMQVMAERILPYLEMQGFLCKVLAVGGHPPAKPLHKDIIFTGAVERVAPYLLAADLAVVPLLQGGGTRMKILDYFAAGLPVISTAKGIEGIPVTNGVEALIVEDADQQFAETIIGLLRDRQAASALGERGRAFVASLDWKQIAQHYLQLLH